MKQKTSLQTETFDSTLEWEIDNFLDYSSCKIDKLESQEIKFDDYYAISWKLTVIPKTPDNDVGLIFSAFDEHECIKKLFKFEVRAEIVGNEMMAPANRHLVKSRGFYAEPAHNFKRAIWTHDFVELKTNTTTFNEDKFISAEELMPYYLNAGVLKLFATATIKTFEIVDSFKN